MQKSTLEDIEKFLKNADFSGYEVKTYLTLLRFKDLTANEISEKSKVPTGRIYEVLDKLQMRELIEVQESRPKRYRAISFNIGLQNLISHLQKERQRKISNLMEQGKALESKIQEENNILTQELSKTFWTTEFGGPNIIALYAKRMKELKKELLFTGFLNENTINVLRLGGALFMGIFRALGRGVKVKILWSFEFDERPISVKEKKRCEVLYENLKSELSGRFHTSLDFPGLEMKCVYQRIATLYDVFDEKRVILKIQDPASPDQIFASVDVLDLKLALELKEKFFKLWNSQTN